MVPLLEARGLKKVYRFRRGPLSRPRELVAVDGVDLTIWGGETLGLVGESGCGKSTLGRLLLRLEEPTAGSVSFEGREIARMTESELRPLRRRMQIVFQDPYTSLNPRKRVREVLEEPFVIHGLVTDRRERLERVKELLRVVGLAEEALDRYPHEFSGGQRQRIGIARAIALGPSFVVADEPVSALDVSVQAQILKLFLELQERMGLTYLFISHDLHVVRYLAQRVAVMYMGRIVELGPRDAIFAEPLHPYTHALLQAVPTLEPGRRPVPSLSGDVPSPFARPRGCPFSPRCPKVSGICREELPAMREVSPGREVACLRI